jgi:hypothetical protein
MMLVVMAGDAKGIFGVGEGDPNGPGDTGFGGIAGPET